MGNIRSLVCLFLILFALPGHSSAKTNEFILEQHGVVFLYASDVMHYVDIINDSKKGDNTASNYFDSLVDQKRAYQTRLAIRVIIIDRYVYEPLNIVKIKDASGRLGVLGWTVELLLQKIKPSPAIRKK